MTSSRYAQLHEEAARRLIPLDVSLELTRACTYRCVHCYVPDLGAPDHVSTDRILGLLEELAAMGTFRLALTGGEPLLRRDWERIVRHARQLGFAVFLLTNGSLVTPAVAATLAELSIVVEVSVFSPDPALSAGITRAPSGLTTATDAVELLRGAGVEVVVKVPVMRANASEVAAIRDFAARVGAECMVFPTITPRQDGDRTPVELRLPPEKAGVFLPAAKCLPPGGDDESLCAAGVRFAAITAKGEVLPCSDLPMVAGNVNQRTFREIWEDSPVLRELRSIRRRDLRTCDTCPKSGYCGRCPAQAFFEDGDLLGPSRWACGRAEAVEKLEADAGAREELRGDGEPT